MISGRWDKNILGTRVHDFSPTPFCPSGQRRCRRPHRNHWSRWQSSMYSIINFFSFFFCHSPSVYWMCASFHRVPEETRAIVERLWVFLSSWFYYLCFCCLFFLLKMCSWFLLAGITRTKGMFSLFTIHPFVFHWGYLITQKLIQHVVLLHQGSPGPRGPPGLPVGFPPLYFSVVCHVHDGSSEQIIFSSSRALQASHHRL